MEKKKLEFNKVTLLHHATPQQDTVQSEALSSRDIAIIGISLQMPQADNVDEFWSNIRGKVDSVRPPSPRRQEQVRRYAAGAYGADYEVKFYNGAGLDDIDSFDYSFFNLSPREASLIDPNQRLFLQTVFSAIEDAGYDGHKLSGSRTGIYVGYGEDGEYHRMIQELQPDALGVALAGNIRSIIASRIAYLLDLKGPSMLIDTACSSSLVAIHLACQSLRTGECELAIAGSVKTYILPLDTSQRIGIESSDGLTRSFDDYSDGTGPGEGVAAIILKTLPQAVKDGDSIYAVIKGSAVNQDGSSIGITSPNVLSQEAVLVQAWMDAGIQPQTLGYMEAHGSGTELGDPIEIDAMKHAFRRFTDKNQFCAVGSIKSNIGHLDHAAGMAGLIKAVLALKHKELPPNLHFDKPNARIDFIHSPVYVNDRLKPWRKGDTPRRCGVSSFGMSGTNCHIVLQEAPEPQQIPIYPQREEILALSAKSPEALLALVNRYVAYLTQHPSVPLVEVCYTANTGRIHHRYRLAVSCSSMIDLRTKLEIAAKQGLVDQPALSIYYGQVAEESEAQERIHPDRHTLSELATRYVAGGEVHWDACYPFVTNKLNLPTYPFEGRPCWLVLPLPQEQMFHHLVWKREPLASGWSEALKGSILVLKDTAGYGTKLVKKWRSQGRRVIEVERDPMSRTVKLNDYHFVVDGTEEGYRFMLDSLEKEPLIKIVHLSSMGCGREPSTLRELEASQQSGMYSLFYCVKKLASQPRVQPIELILAAQYVHEVNLREPRIQPEHATLFGLGKVVGLENPQLKCRTVDIDEATPLPLFIQELEASHESYHVAYRNGERYTEQFAPLSLANVGDHPLSVREDGVYVITGGTGGIGLETAKYLAAQAPVKLALLNRSTLPDRSQWASILANAKQEKLARKLRAIQEIEELGAKVDLYSVDIADYTAMERVFAELRKRYGTIRGVVHGAGVSGSGFLLNREEAAFREVVGSKVQGTWILDACTQKDELDFFVLFSSATTLTGGHGEGDYTAANAYLDAFQAYRNRKGKLTQTINWVAWSETGMAFDYEVGDGDLFEKLTTAEGIGALDTVLRKQVCRTFAGKIAYRSEYRNESLLQHAVLPFLLADEIRAKLDKARSEAAATEGQPTPTKQAAFTALNIKELQLLDIQQAVAEVWKRCLGVQQVGLDESFYALGGNSLLGMEIMLELSKLVGIQLNVAVLLENETLRKLSLYLEAMVKGSSPKTKMMSIPKAKTLS